MFVEIGSEAFDLRNHCRVRAGVFPFSFFILGLGVLIIHFYLRVVGPRQDALRFGTQ